MDYIVWSNVQVDVAINLSLLRRVNRVSTRAESTIHATLEALNNHWYTLSNDRHKSIDEHSLYDIVAYNRVPSRGIISELTIEKFANILINFLKICVDKQDQYRGVKELRSEHSICNFSQHLTVCIIANPCDQTN